MSHINRLRGTAARGLLSVRADAGAPSPAEIKALIESVNRSVAEMRAAHQADIDAMKKGLGDVVSAEKVERINAAVTEQQKALDEAVRSIAALNLGGGNGDRETPEARQHKEAFRAHMQGKVHAAANTYSGPDGGFLAPPTLDLAVTRVVAQRVAMRRLAQVMPISTSSYIKFKSVGGATSGWAGENETGATGRPETNTPTLKRMEFTPQEIYAEPYATQIALDDMAIDVEAWLAGDVGIEFAEEEGDAFIDGNGIKKPMGLLSYTNVANASYSWGSIGYLASGEAAVFKAPTSSVGPGDVFIDTIYALKPAYRANGTWLCNDLTLATMRKFRDGDGNYLWQPSAQAGQPSTFMGYPVETDDNMPDVGANAYPVAFGDFRQAYLIVDRVGMRVLRNPYKSNGLVAFYSTKRVGGGVQNFEAVKLIKIAAS